MRETIARVLAIGDELLLGRTIDTNSGHCAAWLGARGLRVDRLQAVSDRHDETVAALRSACAGAGLVVVTGGLGPTDDDRTRHALATVMGVELEARPAAWRAVKIYYARLGRGPVPPANRRQALLPRGARMLANDRGTAPGMLGRVGDCWVACLPGVPHEMEAMLDRLGRLLPQLLPDLRAPSVAELYLAGVGESAVQGVLGDLMSERSPQVGITASELGHLCLRVVGTRTAVARRTRELAHRVRPWLLPGPGLAASLVELLARRGWTITAAESCTCGLVAAQLGTVPGASQVLLESAVTYASAAKIRRLGVDPALLTRAGVVSAEVAEAMARGAQAWAGADVAVATTGIAGPDGGDRAHPVGGVWLAVSVRGRVSQRHVQLRGTRERVQRRAAAQALLLVWDALREQASDR